MFKKPTDPKAKPQHDDTTEVAKEPRHVASAAKGEKFDHLAARETDTGNRQEALLDEAIEETFPGSDPISPKHIT